jgi:hypothetical protein
MSTTFSISRDTLIFASLKECGAFGTGETPSSEDISDVSLALNILIKSWVKLGMPLWKITEVLIPMIAGNQTYQIGPTATGTGAIVTDRPLRVFDPFIRDGAGNDTTLIILSRQEYEMMSRKQTTGVPNSIYYQAFGGSTVPNGLLTVWTPAADATRTIHLFSQVAISDVNVGTDIMDFPSECYQALKWNLCAEIAGPYVSSAQKIQRIEQKAAQYKTEMENWSVEDSSLYFGMEQRGRGGYVS